MMTAAVWQQTISRRLFLKLTSGFLAHTATSHFSESVEGHSRQVPVPPSLMLHSPDAQGEFLPYLLEQLNEAGFTAVTYRKWQQLVRTNSLPNRPIILSIDDISMARQACSAFATFAQIKKWIQAAGMTAVFGVITEPVINGSAQREQDEERWDEVRGWIAEGFELATHTTYHSNFNALDSGPRPDFNQADYDAEIVDSAQLIEAKMAERGLKYPVKTLIMPYGSGFSYKLTPSEIHSGILQSCRQTNIEMVVGIAQGRAPLSRPSLLSEQDAVYVGRVPPAYITGENGGNIPHADLTLSWLHSWHENNYSSKFKHS